MAIYRFTSFLKKTFKRFLELLIRVVHFQNKKKSHSVSIKLFKEVIDWREIPVIINNRDRLSYLKCLLDWLDKSGMRNVVILDNDSTYEPLLEFYSKDERRVIRLKKNFGYNALWSSGIVKKIWKNFFIYTDSDVVPDENCPLDAVSYFLSILKTNDFSSKVGFGLRIDNIPDHYPEKENVLQWEKQFWLNKLGPEIYDATIDTTFALYRPFFKPSMPYRCIRTGFPYVARHLPWYESKTSLPEDERYYREHILPHSTWWSGDNEIKQKLLKQDT